MTCDEMKNPVEQINNIANMDDFLNFVVQLAMDAKNNPDEWVNTTITDYLGQIASWLDDYSAFNHDVEWDHINYKAFAQMLYMGKIYE